MKIIILLNTIANLKGLIGMTEKRFWILNTLTKCSGIKDRNKLLTFNEVVDVLNSLNDENEQLKKRNDRQAKQLDRLYNLIEQKDWRALNDILDDFKQCEEQLQRESGTYGDVE